MTEDEAKTKWCPFSRVPVGYTSSSYASVTTETVSANRTTYVGDNPRNPKQLAGTNCLGSGCAAWQWLVQPGSYAAVSPRENWPGKCGLTTTPRLD